MGREQVAALKDKELVPEAIIEQDTMRSLMAQLGEEQPDREIFNAKVKVLSEYVKHHVKEEHDEMLPRAKSSKLDLVELGAQLLARKAELVSDAN